MVIGTSGCLTFQFQRYGTGFFCSSGGSPGWSATISCTAPPPSGDNCMGALPFCSSTAYNFPNNTGTSAPSGPNYGCLGSEPNPVWYYMEIDVSGPLQISLSQTTGPGGTGSGIDVDFALWGPVSSVGAGCTSIMGGGVSPLQCSYSASPTETIGLGYTGGYLSGQSTPPNAIAGQVYILLLTNYSGLSGYISFSQTAGSGQADCSIVLPIELAAFEGTNVGRRNMLTWITASEQNNAYFALEKSVDGLNWETIEHIAGQGTSVEMKKYTAFDDNFESTLNYYRLVQHDYNGLSKVSNTVTIDNSIKDKVLQKVVNTIGQEVELDHPGLVLLIYDDGTIVKKMN